MAERPLKSYCIRLQFLYKTQDIGSAFFSGKHASVKPDFEQFAVVLAYIPGFIPYLRQDSTNSLTISPFPSLYGELPILYPCAFVGHRLKPLQCLATNTAYFAPRLLAVLSHWSVSSLSGLKVEASGCVPHSGQNGQ